MYKGIIFKSNYNITNNKKNKLRVTGYIIENLVGNFFVLLDPRQGFQMEIMAPTVISDWSGSPCFYQMVDPDPLPIRSNRSPWLKDTFINPKSSNNPRAPKIHLDGLKSNRLQVIRLGRVANYPSQVTELYRPYRC